MLFDSIVEAIGRTPLCRLRRVGAELPVELFAKVEALNPGGSAKDRIARSMILAAEREGRLQPGQLIVEATAGNTGIGLAMVAAARGYRCLMVVPHGTSPSKLAAARALGAEIHECEEMEDWVERARVLAVERGAFNPDQFGNPRNPEAHLQTTAEELWADLEGRIDVFVAACGTGGTLAGVGRALRALRPEVELVRVIPGNALGESRIEGIAPQGPPPEFECPPLSHVVRVTDEESLAAKARLAREEGLLVGDSSGAALAGALKYAAAARPGTRVVVFLPDTGRNYLGHRP